MTEAGVWTADEAADWFTAQGDPIEAWQLRLHIKALRWEPAGEARAGPKGGRGRFQYPIAALMELHRDHVRLAGLGRHAAPPGGP